MSLLCSFSICNWMRKTCTVRDVNSRHPFGLHSLFHPCSFGSRARTCREDIAGSYASLLSRYRDIALQRDERRNTEGEKRRGCARDSWQPVTKGHEILAPLLRLVVGGYRDVLILPRVPRGEIDTHRDPFPFPFPSPLPPSPHLPLPLPLRRALSCVFARDGLALIDLARRTLIGDEKKGGGMKKQKKKKKRRWKKPDSRVPSENWMISCIF